MFFKWGLKASVVKHQVKPLLANLVSHIIVLVHRSILLMIKLPCHVTGKAEDDSTSTWVPAIHMRDSDRGPCSGFRLAHHKML